jgi:hypothetical protein
MDPITMAMMEEAAAAFLKDQAVQAMGPELAMMGGSQAVQGMGGDMGGLLGQTQSPQMFNQTPAGTMSPSPEISQTAIPELAVPTPPGMANLPAFGDTLQKNVMSDFNKSTAGQAYNTFTNPNATTSDYTSLAYKTAFSPEAEKQNQMSIGQMPSMPMGGGGRVTTVGGIPDLLKRYGSNPGLLQYLG